LGWGWELRDEHRGRSFCRNIEDQVYDGEALASVHTLCLITFTANNRENEP